MNTNGVYGRVTGYTEDNKMYGLTIVEVDGLKVSGLNLIHDDFNNGAVVMLELEGIKRLKVMAENNGKNWKTQIVKITSITYEAL
jgi:hypothetical protein